jgi:hypothetical protein
MASPLNRHCCAQIEWNLQYKDDVRIREFRSPLTCRTWLCSPLFSRKCDYHNKSDGDNYGTCTNTRRRVKVPREDARRTHALASAHTQPRSHEPAIDLHLRESREHLALPDRVCAGRFVRFSRISNELRYIYIFGLVFARIRCKFTPDYGVCSNRRLFRSN